MMIAMKLRHEIRYDASVEEVYAMLSEPDFRRRSCAAMGAVSAEVSIEPVGEGMTVLVDQVQRTDGVPAFARKLVGETTRAVQHEVWSDHGNATLRVTTPGKPTEISGRLTLTADGASTVETFEGDVRVRMPLVGGKFESLLAGLFRSGMNKEHTAGVAWLAGER
jgi:uncharacterized protein YndB with AHSA1/START domain